MAYGIGIDLGGTNIKAIAITPEGETLARVTAPTKDDRELWAEWIRSQVEGLERAQGAAASWIGLAAPGLAAPDGRSIAWMQGRMESVQGVDWTDFLQSASPVPVLNDAHAALLGEVWQGAAAGRRNVVMLTLGTGVGGGAMVDGRLLRGHIGRAGHLGHICLNPAGPQDIVGTPGSLEDAVGDCTIGLRSGGRFGSTLELVEALSKGDESAAVIWSEAVQRLACGLVSLINVLDPEVLILGGGIAGAGDALFSPLQESMERYEWRPTGSRVRLVPAALGEWAGAVGAAYNGISERAACE